MKGTPTEVMSVVDAARKGGANSRKNMSPEDATRLARRANRASQKVRKAKKRLLKSKSKI